MERQLIQTHMKTEQTDFLVIGAGLQGSAIALELARRGQRVILADQDWVAMNRASLRNEGKIHLGLIYAADTSGNSAMLQLKGALYFENFLRSWVGSRFDHVGISTPFTYLVAQDSLLDADVLAKHYARVEDACLHMCQENPALNYLGKHPGVLASRVPLSTFDGVFETRHFAAAFNTVECAIDTDDLAEVVRDALKANEDIRFLPGLKVDDIQKIDDEFEVSGFQKADGSRTIIRAKYVLNATWEQRMKLDAMMGVDHEPGWLHRLKYRAIVRLPEGLRGYPSATMVLGRYGDVVIRPNMTAFLSWYPSGLLGWSHDQTPPESWDIPATGSLPPDQVNALGAEFMDKIAQWYPSLASASLLSVDAGTIFAYGRTDVDDRSSGLHDRTHIGVLRRGNYFSVNPGKLTTAPLIAVEAVDQILGQEYSLLHK